jgi:hypothetical protein
VRRGTVVVMRVGGGGLFTYSLDEKTLFDSLYNTSA